MDTKQLREQIQDTYVKMMHLIDAYESTQLVSQNVSVKKVLVQELDELIVDEDFIMNPQSEQTLREVDKRLMESLNLQINLTNKEALVIVMMDNSGSMGIYEKYISGCVWRRLERLFQYKYPKVQFRYIHHHTDATEVNQEQFYQKGTSGGTICSSAYRKANEIIEEYDYINNDVYVLHISDGDNLTSDNYRTVKLAEKIAHKSKFVGYLEVNQYNRHSTLLKGHKDTLCLKDIMSEKFYYSVIRDKEGVYETVSEFAFEMFEK